MSAKPKKIHFRDPRYPSQVACGTRHAEAVTGDFAEQVNCKRCLNSLLMWAEVWKGRAEAEDAAVFARSRAALNAPQPPDLETE